MGPSKTESKTTLALPHELVIIKYVRMDEL